MKPAESVVSTIDRMTPLDELPEWLRVDECAAWLGISKGLVFELCRRGELQSIRLGRLLRVPKVALDALRNGRG